MTHTYMELPKGWSVEYLRDDSDYFINLLTKFSIEIKNLMKNKKLEAPPINNEINNYLSNSIDNVLLETKQKIRTEKDLQGCTFVKYVKQTSMLRAEVRMEESRHDTVIEVEALVYKVDSECNVGCNRTNIYFWEEDYTIMNKENSNQFKARAANDVCSQMEIMDMILINNSHNK